LSGRGRIKKRNHRGTEGAELHRAIRPAVIPAKAGIFLLRSEELGFFHHEDTKFTKKGTKKIIKKGFVPFFVNFVSSW
jgi:hypothetical protein